MCVHVRSFQCVFVCACVRTFVRACVCVLRRVRELNGKRKTQHCLLRVATALLTCFQSSIDNFILVPFCWWEGVMYIEAILAFTFTLGLKVCILNGFIGL